MAERRKIVIETGAGEPLSTPHFDAEATLTARPVVPLTDQEAYRATDHGYAASPGKAFWKRPALLIPIILAAVGIGIAAGFAIGIYRNRSAAQTPVVVAPTPAAENTDLSRTVEPPPPVQEEASEPEPSAAIAEEKEEAKEEEVEEPAVVARTEERERSTRNERRDENDDNEARQPVAAKPPAISRERKPIKVDEYEIEDNGRTERQAERERRREERRERRRRQRQDDLNLPRGIERGVREADRIREIFEGRQP